MPPADLPLPPADIAVRAGPGAEADKLEAYLSEGASVRRRIEAALPPDWTWDGKRVLDFGCSSGRVLRHFADEAQRAELIGCDIDAASIAWLRNNLSPPFQCFANGPAPPLPLEDDSIDLVWATSVFTHIDDWASWLLEMHRILVPGGLLVSSFLGEGMWEAMLGQPYVPDEVGMTTLHHWTGPGADVLHSEWWLREHWGRAFDVISVEGPPRNPDGSPQVTHSYITAAKLPGVRTAEELGRIDLSEPREVAALKTNVALHRLEAALLAEHRSLRGEVRARARSRIAALPGMHSAAAAYRRLRPRG